MAEDENSEGLLNLSLTQKLQLGAVGTGTLVFLLTYIIAVLLNGFNYTHQWMLNNIIPVLAFWSFNIGMLPVYKKVDPRRVKYLKQSIYKFVMWGGFFPIAWIYYQFIPPTTGIDRIVSKLSYVFTFAAITGILITYSNFKIQTGKNN